MSTFFSSEEAVLGRQYLEQGYVIRKAEAPTDLQMLAALVNPHEPAVEGLNELKLDVMRRLNSADWTRGAYYRLAAKALQAIVGNELAMQRKFNLNVQVPNDERNLLPIHADTWTGDSPFQVVLWVPLVDCYRTKAMWILPPEHAGKFRLEGDSEGMFRRIEPFVKYVDISYGDVLIFNSCLPHGNRVNREDSTRWSLNLRFKGVFTPYGRKELGEHFEPITLRPASRIGLDYRHPSHLQMIIDTTPDPRT